LNLPQATICADSEDNDTDKTYCAKKTPVVSEKDTSSSHEGHTAAEGRKPMKKKAKVSIGVGVSKWRKQADKFLRPSSFYQMVPQTFITSSVYITSL
jgi:hypothetical protein